jgi:hypothetical protein
VPIASASADYVYALGVLHTSRTLPGSCARSTASCGVAVAAWSCSIAGGHSSTTSTSWSCAGWGVHAPLARCHAPGGGGDRQIRGALAGHRALLRRHALAYITDRQLFLSNTTDGLGNRLSKVFSRRQALQLFANFGDVETEVLF